MIYKCAGPVRCEFGDLAPGLYFFFCLATPFSAKPFSTNLDAFSTHLNGICDIQTHKNYYLECGALDLRSHVLPDSLNNPKSAPDCNIIAVVTCAEVVSG